MRVLEVPRTGVSTSTGRLIRVLPMCWSGRTVSLDSCLSPVTKNVMHMSDNSNQRTFLFSRLFFFKVHVS